MVHWIETEGAKAFPRALKISGKQRYVFSAERMNSPERSTYDFHWWVLAQLTNQGWEPFSAEGFSYDLRKQYDD
jgi:hypothetical protein